MKIKNIWDFLIAFLNSFRPHKAPPVKFKKSNYYLPIIVGFLVLSIAGTGNGADTAIVIQPANSTRIFDMTIKEIIAKPRTR